MHWIWHKSKKTVECMIYEHFAVMNKRRTRMDKIAVLIPCYNEEKRLKRLSGTQKQRFRRRLFMYITTILPTALQSWQKGRCSGAAGI